jgi:ubiquinone/menaquinone biosynthesis C-methylase UbiE
VTAFREHYSYEHYADAGVADRFDALRFGGPIGRYLLDTQQSLLVQALSPVRGSLVLDVGTGTGRAALGLTDAGARVIGLDYSAEMLRVARSRAVVGQVRVQFSRADAHALPIADRSVDAAVSLRVLMHAIDWRRCVAELCRVARRRVVVDFPARASLAALESATRRLRRTIGGNVESYRVIGVGQMRAAFAAHGFHEVSIHKQFVLPIALHKAIGRLPVTRAVESGLAVVGLRHAFGSPVTMVFERRAADVRPREESDSGSAGARASGGGAPRAIKE